MDKNSQKKEIRDIIAGCCNEVVFSYEGKKAGVTSEVENSIPTFQAWFGNEIKEYMSVDEVVNDKFYNGKSINDLIGIVDFGFI